MKALTLRPEFADLILSGAKIIENRSWGSHGKLAGKRIAIHRGTDHENNRPGAIVCTVVIKAIIDVKLAKRLFPKQRKHIHGPKCWVLGDLIPVQPVECTGRLSLWDIPKGSQLIPLN